MKLVTTWTLVLILILLTPPAYARLAGRDTKTMVFETMAGALTQQAHRTFVDTTSDRELWYAKSLLLSTPPF